MAASKLPIPKAITNILRIIKVYVQKYSRPEYCGADRPVKNEVTQAETKTLQKIILNLNLVIFTPFD